MFHLSWTKLGDTLYVSGIRKLLLFYFYLFLTRVWFWVSRWIRLTMSSTWFAGGVTRCMTALLSSGSSGWTPSLRKPVLVTHLHIITSIGSVWFQCIVATGMVSVRLIQLQCLMSKTVFYFITSNYKSFLDCKFVLQLIFLLCIVWLLVWRLS